MSTCVGGEHTISKLLQPSRAVTRAVLAVIALSIAACGGSNDSEPASGATRPKPTTPRSTSPPPSPDAGLPEGHAAADARRHRCRATRSPRFRLLRQYRAPAHLHVEARWAPAGQDAGSGKSRTDFEINTDRPPSPRSARGTWRGPRRHRVNRHSGAGFGDGQPVVEAGLQEGAAQFLRAL